MNKEIDSCLKKRIKISSSSIFIHQSIHRHQLETICMRLDAQRKEKKKNKKEQKTNKNENKGKQQKIKK